MKASFMGGSSGYGNSTVMNRNILLGFTTLLAVSATATLAAPHDGLIRLGRSIRVEGAIIRPFRVIEDSRCPANARCIWAGRLVIQTDVHSSRRHQRIDLTLGEPKPFAGGMLTLSSASPARYTNRPIRPGDYRVGFEFKR